MPILLRALSLVAVLLHSGCTQVDQPPALTRTEGYVDASGGVRLFYRTLGDRGDTVVVLHGGPGFSMSYLQADLEPLATQHVLLFYDQRGSGRSTLVADSVSLDAQRFADDLEAVRRSFDLERLNLLGHSWGAAVAALYASRHPERLRRLLLVNPGGFDLALDNEAFLIADSRRDSATRSRLEELERAYLGDPGDAAACRGYHELFFAAVFADVVDQRRSRGDVCSGSPEALRNKVENVDRITFPSLGDWDWKPALGAVGAPALVIHGAMDAVPLESAREWTLALPNARLLVLEESGHFSYLEAPERFFGAARTFLAGGWPEGAEAVTRAPAR